MEPLPEVMTRFILENVETIDQLEILRILGEDREKEWDFAVLADAVQAEPQAIRDHLMALHGRGLVMTAVREAGLSCRYGVSTPQLAKLVSRLLQIYEERPVTMIKLVYQQAQDRDRGWPEGSRSRMDH